MKHSILIICLFGAFSVLLFAYGFLLEPYDVQIHDVYIHDSSLAHILGGKVVVQLSDIHMGTTGRREQSVTKILTRLDPDIIFLTGDYVSWKSDYTSALTYLSKFHAKIGIWAVMGDYDYSNSRRSCLFCHKENSGEPSARHSFRFLRNSFEQVKLAEGSLIIAGIDTEYEEAPDIKILNALNNFSAPTIVLCHNPLAFNLISDKANLLMLSGDTHGGQVPLPSWFWRLIGYEKNAEYSQGLFRRGNKQMFVSRGIGWSHIPIRIFRKPEVSVLHFTN